MKRMLQLEEVSMFLLSLLLFHQLGFAWWWFLLLFLLPDLSMVGYSYNSRFGSTLYNLVHHRGVAIVLYILGVILSNPWLQLIGTVFLGHTSVDRIFGYGLKFPDSFKHTHLGWLDRASPDSKG